MIVGLCGKSGSGKDEVGRILCESVKGMHRLAFADELKRDVYELNSIADVGGGLSLSEAVDKYGWDEAKRKFPLIRTELQTYGMKMREERGADYWIERLEKVRIRLGGGKDNQHFVVCDVRMPNEAEYVMNMSGMLVTVERPREIGVSLEGAAASHISESMEVKSPYHLDNSGDLEYLRVQVEETFRIKDGRIRGRGHQVKTYLINNQLRCTKCNEWKVANSDNFYRMNKVWNGWASYCKPCYKLFLEDRPYRQKEFRRKECESTAAREWDLKNKFGITLADYNLILDKQNGVCAICQSAETKVKFSGEAKALAVDHDHETGVAEDYSAPLVTWQSGLWGIATARS